MAKTRRTKKPKMSFNERVRKVIKGEAETKEKVVNYLYYTDKHYLLTCHLQSLFDCLGALLDHWCH